MNTKTAKVPTMATMRAALKKADALPAEDTPKAIKAAYLTLKATPAKDKAPAKAKKTPAKAPAVKATPKAPANCGCGCGAPTITAKATFLPGHDARLAGVLGREWAREDLSTEEADALEARIGSLTPALQAKVRSVTATVERKRAEKVAREVAKKAAAEAFKAAMAAAK